MKNSKPKTPASHQPTKAEMEKPVKIKATLDKLGEAVTRGGAERQEQDRSEK